MHNHAIAIDKAIAWAYDLDMNQLDIFAPPSTSDAKFWKFHHENPQVYRKLVELASEARGAGRKRIGINMLFEVVRWNHLVHTRSDDFALNNNYAPRYARIIEERNPELKGIFEMRRIRTWEKLSSGFGSAMKR